jgi:hypothetical protein
MRSENGASQSTEAETAIVICPDCGERLVLRGVLQLGTQIWCRNCEAELEIVNLEPVEVDGVSLESDDEEQFLVRW